MTRRLFTLYAALLLIIGFLPAPPPARAALEENSLLHLRPGDTVPAFTLPEIGGRRDYAYDPATAGKPQVLIFFSLAPRFRAKRSLDLIGALAPLAAAYDGKVAFAAVYSAPKGQDLIPRLKKDGLMPLPVLDDKDRALYRRYGVFMLPIVVISNAHGALQAVIPATGGIAPLVDNNLKLALGLISEKDFKKALRPQGNIVRTKEEKEYIRRVNYGRVMARRKMYRSAQREFATAVKMVKRPVRALIGMGYVHLAMKKWDRAAADFQRALDLDENSDTALAGLGIALYRQGKTAKALPILENALISEAPPLEVITTLADIYEERGMIDKAVRLNKLAVERLLKKFQ